MTERARRSYQGSHPWITFELDLRRAGPELWMLLAEARATCGQVAMAPLRPQTADELHRLFIAKGVAGTTAIEGNTLTEDEVRQIIEGKLRLPPSREYLHREVLNVIAACDEITTLVLSANGLVLTPELVLHFNALVLNGLSLEEGAVPGELRTYSVGVLRYKAPPAEDCHHLLERLCSWLADGLSWSFRDRETELAFLKAILGHLYVAWIHPFGDGNGRTARLVELSILLSSGIPTPAAHLLSNHYNLTRSEYYRQLDATSKSGGDVLPFIQYALQGLVDGLREQLRIIGLEQQDIAWRNFVYEVFRQKVKGMKPADQRRRQIVLDLSRITKPVLKSEIMTLTPELMGHFAGKTLKTLSRDLNELLAMDLIRQAPGGYVARRERILAFVPERTF